MNEPRTIFFVGKPGCGKGTQAKLLSEKTGWPVIAAGAQFRSIAAEETPVGKKVREEVDAGLLAPYWFAIYLYQKALFSLSEGQSVIFDGFNRKEEEARLVIDSLRWLERPFSVVHLDISDDAVVGRLESRRSTDPRADDLSVDQRLVEYHAHTAPAIELFRAEEVLVDIDGEQSPEEIAAQVAQALTIA